MTRWQYSALSLLTCLTLVGCGSSTSTHYGTSGGLAGKQSMNGFGALRRSYEQAGYSTRDIYRLTDRIGRSEVIVWTPKAPHSISPEVTRWFERWFSRGGRTLVYIVPDSGSDAQYWEEALSLAPPEQRLEYRRRLAQSRSQRMRWTINRRTIPTNGWFVIEPSSQRSKIGSLSGDWVDDQVADHAEPLLTEYRVLAYDPNQPAAVATGNYIAGTGPGAPNYVYYLPTEVSSTKASVAPQLESESGDTIVAEVTSEGWKNSKIIVVSGGSLLTNFAFTREFNRRLADRLVTHSAPSRGSGPGLSATAGFLTSDMTPIPVSERQRGIPKASGMELLTVWPMSLVTIHAAMLGIVICMIMLPAFGRPRKVERGTTSSFGDHLDAVAALMSRAGGETHARAKISEYFRRMHGETSGPWILPESQTAELLPPLSPEKTAGAESTSRSEKTSGPANPKPDASPTPLEMLTGPDDDVLAPADDDVFAGDGDVLAPSDELSAPSGQRDSAPGMERRDGPVRSSDPGGTPRENFDDEEANR